MPRFKRGVESERTVWDKRAESSCGNAAGRDDNTDQPVTPPHNPDSRQVSRVGAPTPGGRMGTSSKKFWQSLENLNSLQNKTLFPVSFRSRGKIHALSSKFTLTMVHELQIRHNIQQTAGTYLSNPAQPQKDLVCQIFPVSVCRLSILSWRLWFGALCRARRRRGSSSCGATAEFLRELSPQ